MKRRQPFSELMAPTRSRHPKYGQGVARIVVDADRFLTSDELAARMLGVFRSPDYRAPALPRVGMELLELSRKSDVSFDEVIKLLEQDPMIAGRVLARAQSGAYATAVPATSLHQALVRLGLKTLACIVLEESMSLRMFRVKGYERPMEALRVHSTAVARAARLVAMRTALPHDYAFMCGLLHDVGVAACISTLSHQREKPPEWEWVKPAVQQAHDEVSAHLAELWSLPPDLCIALRAHHSLTIGGRVHPMAAAICLGDHLACELGFSNISTPSPADVAQARKALSLDDRLWSLIAAQTADALADIT